MLILYYGKVANSTQKPCFLHVTSRKYLKSSNAAKLIFCRVQSGHQTLVQQGKKTKNIANAANTYFAAFAIKYHVFPNCLLCTIRNERRSYQALEILLYRYDYSLVSRPLFDPLFDPLAVFAMFTLFNSSYTFIEIP